MSVYRLQATSFINTMPVQVAPHFPIPVMSSNEYLPQHFKHRKDATLLPVDGPIKSELTPRVNWRGVGDKKHPVIAASTLKGALRHHLTEFVTRGMTGLSTEVYNLLALGGVISKGDKATMLITEREDMRKRYPTLSLFGSMLVPARIKVFSDATPQTSFELDWNSIIRTDLQKDEAAVERCDEQEMIDAQIEEAANGSKKKGLDDQIKAIGAAIREGTKKGMTAAEIATLKAKQSELYRELDAHKEDAKTAQKQLPVAHRIPAQVSWAQQIILHGDDGDLAMLLIAFETFAEMGCVLGGGGGMGAGSMLDMEYEVIRDGEVIGNFHCQPFESDFSDFAEIIAGKKAELKTLTGEIINVRLSDDAEPAEEVFIKPTKKPVVKRARQKAGA